MHAHTPHTHTWEFDCKPLDLC